jgi:myo-inositol-1-phosphate synthase
MPARKKVRVAIIGVGNCASSLVQGVHYYRDAKPADNVTGLMHVDLGGYHIRDIEFAAAFDVVKGKVGLDLSEALFAITRLNLLTSLILESRFIVA